MTDAPPPPASPPTPPPPAASSAGGDEKNLGMLCHLSALAGFTFPFGNIIAPLVIWLMKRETMPFVNGEGMESLNFQITMSIAALLCIPLIFVFIGLLLLPAVALVNLIFIIVAAVTASKGTPYRYPICIRFIK